ncbi:MAG: 3-isopropylmalate dehydrogenase [Deltaproteobacteria bacterium]|nr:3-isopropylmalate dehydrogenase [Deltaproteobacteria bacterium]
METLNVLVLGGDGIGPEVAEQAVAVLQAVTEEFGIGLNLEEAAIGGVSIDQNGVPVTRQAIDLARSSDAVLLGAVGGAKWDSLPSHRRPERGFLELRDGLSVFANLRPTKLFPMLADASPLRPERARSVDFVIVRELLGDVYFGNPRGVWDECESRKGVNTMVYTEGEIRRIGRTAFEMARRRGKKLASVDKANVLEVQALWRDVISELGSEYPDVTLNHLYVDACAMQLVLDPRRFDVIVTGNLFGDILSDEAAALAGSIGLLPSASIGGSSSLYEPIHGSAPDLVGTGKANPVGAILSVAMLLEYTLGRPDLARVVEQAVESVLDQGLRTADIAGTGAKWVSGSEMGAAIVQQVRLAANAPTWVAQAR